MQILNNPYLIPALMAWLIAQVLKMIIDLITMRELNMYRLVSAGGMPSSHSSMAAALAVSLGKAYGLDSAYFAISAVFAAIVMYDAAGVRRETGIQGKMLNWMAENWHEDDAIRYEKKLKEVVGHTPVEVFAGAVLGIVIGYIWN